MVASTLFFAARCLGGGHTKHGEGVPLCARTTTGQFGGSDWEEDEGHNSDLPGAPLPSMMSRWDAPSASGKYPPRCRMERFRGSFEPRNVSLHNSGWDPSCFPSWHLCVLPPPGYTFYLPDWPVIIDEFVARGFKGFGAGWRNTVVDVHPERCVLRGLHTCLEEHRLPLLVSGGTTWSGEAFCGKGHRRTGGFCKQVLHRPTGGSLLWNDIELGREFCGIMSLMLNYFLFYE